MSIDFNGVPAQNFETIPEGTILPVRMQIKPGGYTDIQRGWDSGYATRNNNTGTVYLVCEFTVTGGQYIKRKIKSMIGLHSPNSEKWENMGKSFIRSILDSAYGLDDKDESEQAKARRRINSLADIDGIEFVAKVGITTDQNGNNWNEIKTAIMVGNQAYAQNAQYLRNNGVAAPMAQPVTQSVSQPTAQAQAAPVAEVPHWATNDLNQAR